jgi:hypothetical protein
MEPELDGSEQEIEGHPIARSLLANSSFQPVRCIQLFIRVISLPPTLEAVFACWTLSALCPRLWSCSSRWWRETEVASSLPLPSGDRTIQKPVALFSDELWSDKTPRFSEGSVVWDPPCCLLMCRPKSSLLVVRCGQSVYEYPWRMVSCEWAR